MTIKVDDPDQQAADQRALDAAEKEIQAERNAKVINYYNEIIANMPADLTLDEVGGVFLRLLAVGVIQVHDRVKRDALDAAKRLGDQIPKVVEIEWGSPGHQRLLGSRAKEVN